MTYSFIRDHQYPNVREFGLLNFGETTAIAVVIFHHATMDGVPVLSRMTAGGVEWTVSQEIPETLTEALVFNAKQDWLPVSPWDLFRVEYLVTDNKTDNKGGSTS